MPKTMSVLNDQIRHVVVREVTAILTGLNGQIGALTKRLALLEKQPKAAAKPRRKATKFKQSADQTILTLLQKRKGVTTTDINAAWKKEGRAGNANVNLSKLVKAKKVKRTTLQGQNKSLYSLA